jgi:hypothetical protein
MIKALMEMQTKQLARKKGYAPKYEWTKKKMLQKIQEVSSKHHLKIDMELLEKKDKAEIFGRYFSNEGIFYENGWNTEFYGVDIEKIRMDFDAGFKNEQFALFNEYGAEITELNQNQFEYYESKEDMETRFKQINGWLEKELSGIPDPEEDFLSKMKDIFKQRYGYKSNSFKAISVFMPERCRENAGYLEVYLMEMQTTCVMSKISTEPFVEGENGLIDAVDCLWRMSEPEFDSAFKDLLQDDGTELSLIEKNLQRAYFYER